MEICTRLCQQNVYKSTSLPRVSHWCKIDRAPPEGRGRSSADFVAPWELQEMETVGPEVDFRLFWCFAVVERMIEQSYFQTLMDTSLLTDFQRTIMQPPWIYSAFVKLKLQMDDARLLR